MTDSLTSGGGARIDASVRRDSIGGFTLVELIVVLTILGILAALSAPSIVSYVKHYNDRQSVTEAKILVNGVKSLLSFDYSEGRQEIDPNVFDHPFPDSAAYGFADNGVAAGKIKGSSGLNIPVDADVVVFNVAAPEGTGYGRFDLDNLIYYPGGATDPGNRAIVYVKGTGYFVLDETTASPLQQLTDTVASGGTPTEPDS
ncbi:MAG: type II secretion system GspH family protein [Clostridiales Family XIII bacterium]|jgi:prepilin-type N-terminal cleavage/methylation domain-containing protein|nr:type II secretion system GspH family protein [Clostridiales Family XIII bacterium]